MDLMPILSTLRRHKTAAFLIVLEIALACAIVCNALHLIGIRVQALGRESGLAEHELISISVGGAASSSDNDALTQRDLAALSAVPGVKSVTLTNQPHYGNNSTNSSASLKPERDAPGTVSSLYMMATSAVPTLGLQLVAGRNFLPEEVQMLSTALKQEQRSFPAVIVNQALVTKLFGNEPALGKVIYIAGMGGTPSTIVGIVKTLTPPRPDSENDAQRGSVVLPVMGDFRNGNYMLRVDPAQRDAVLKAAREAVQAVDPRRIVNTVKTVDEMRRDFYAQDRAMAGLLAGVALALLLVTAFGIVGLASFWVQQRTRMIGTRRALGATQGQILRYFQLENLLLSSAGIVLGMGAAYAISLVLMQQYELPRLPWFYLPFGALALWALGQLAVWAPARRAAALPPVAALRA